MDILRTNMAPISDAAWEIINEEARRVLRSILSARKFVEVDGPHGLELESVPSGRLELKKHKENFGYGIRRALPLIESRAEFELNIWEMDNAQRGAEDIDVSPMEQAARRVAEFEETCVYEGLGDEGIPGLKGLSEQEPIAMSDNPEEIMDSVSHALIQFASSAVEGPYSLIVGHHRWAQLATYVHGYPLRRHLKSLLGGKIILSPYIEETILVSERGGDFQLTLGQDLTIGYLSHNADHVRLYFTESFAFQVFDPTAYIFFN